eukprot:g29279.t1
MLTEACCSAFILEAMLRVALEVVFGVILEVILEVAFMVILGVVVMVTTSVDVSMEVNSLCVTSDVTPSMTLALFAIVQLPGGSLLLAAPITPEVAAPGGRPVAWMLTEGWAGSSIELLECPEAKRRGVRVRVSRRRR